MAFTSLSRVKVGFTKLAFAHNLRKSSAVNSGVSMRGSASGKADSIGGNPDRDRHAPGALGTRLHDRVGDDTPSGRPSAQTGNAHAGPAAGPVSEWRAG